MKKFLCFLLAALMVLTAVACGPADPSGEDTADTTANLDTAADPSADETDAATTAAREEVEAPYVYKHVVVIGVDGAGTFFKEADTPNLDAIFAEGAVTYEAITATPSISAQSWGSLFHGVTPEFHQLNNTVTGAQAYPSDSPYPSFFRVVREQMPEASLASFCNWNNINIGIIEDDIGVHKDHASSDLKVIKMASDYVSAEVANGNGAPTLLFIHLDEADGAGHSSGYGTPSHLKKIKQQDGWIKQLYDTYRDLDLLEDTLFIVTTDHGGLGTSHGGDSEIEMKIMFAATGKTVEKGTIGEMGIRDTAAIVLHALGLSAHQPETWTARVPSGLFEGVVAGERPVCELPPSQRAHENVPTPTVGSEGHISNFITDKNLTAYLTFDGDITDACGAATTKTGNLYFVEGYFGQGVSLNDGYVTIPDYVPGTDSFSVSLWVNTTGVSSDPALFANKDWASGSNPGYILSINSDGVVKFNVGNGTDRADQEIVLPGDYATGWVHLLLVVDRAAGEVRMAYDFGSFQTLALSDALKDATFEGCNVLNIGQDGTGAYSASLAATLDEFMIFDGALTAEDVAALKAYYGK